MRRSSIVMFPLSNEALPEFGRIFKASYTEYWLSFHLDCSVKLYWRRWWELKSPNTTRVDQRQPDIFLGFPVSEKKSIFSTKNKSSCILTHKIGILKYMTFYVVKRSQPPKQEGFRIPTNNMICHKLDLAICRPTPLI